MNLIEEFKTECVLIEKKRIPDGEGGLITTWEDGALFTAAIAFDSSLQARVAEKQGVTSVYTVTVGPATKLVYHDVFRRVSDGKIFRVTSDGDDVVTPSRATFRFSQVTAEEWELPA